jgi:endonuclease/exonuclease/phosphatase family metal-dependent hydrolase
VSYRGDTDGIYSRLPFTSRHVNRLLLNDAPTVTFSVGGRPLRLVAVHIDGAQHGAADWRNELRALRPIARDSSGDAFVVAGDFNATRWNPPFHDLLRSGLTDAHEARGRGLSRSWPVRGTVLSHLGPLMRLDHALVNRHIAVERVRDVSVPGSDHVGFAVTLGVGT